jgi:sec-independent protein translocase protein TatA
MPIGIPELLVILLIVVIIFGASKLPKLGQGLGEGIRNFKKGLRGNDSAPADESQTKSAADSQRPV